MRPATTTWVTEFPTLHPDLLAGRPVTSCWPPFAGGQRYWYYLARNAVYEAVRRLGLAGRSVLMPSYHHGVEVEAVVAAGARPVFYRVDENWRVDLADLTARISADVGALYLIHYAGFPGPGQAMKELARSRGLVLIEDCALALLSSSGGRPLGLDGDVSIFCLYKTLPVPSGGALLVNRPLDEKPGPRRRPPRLATTRLVAASMLQNMEMRAGRSGRRMLRLARSLGKGAAAAGRVRNLPVGTMNFSADTADLGIAPISLAIASRQSAERIIATRRRNYRLLGTLLQARARPLRSSLDAGVCPLFFPLWVADKPAAVKGLRQLGIEAVDFWSAGHPACDPARFPEAARARTHILEVPCHQDLNESTIERLAARVRQVLEASGQARCSRPEKS